MALTIVRGPQVPIGVRIGYAKAPTAKMVLMSLTNGDITVTCAGASNSPITVTPTATDTDGGAHSPAGYTATVTLTGLSEFTEYTFTASQVGNTVGMGSIAGSFTTLPSSQDNFYFWALSCDAGAATGNDIHTGHGFYKNIREHVDPNGLRCAGILHVDDHGYVSSRAFTDSAAPGMIGVAPSVHMSLYAYSAAYLNYYGLYPNGSGNSGFGEASLKTTTANIDIGRNPDRVWCMQNLPVWPQWGDWEFQDDLGMDQPTPRESSQYFGFTMYSQNQSYHKTFVDGVGQRDGPGLLAWQKFMSPIQPPSIASSDMNANHWAFDLGCIRVIATDGITNSDGALQGNYGGDITADDAAVPQIPAMLGMNQIADIKDAADPNAAFTLLGMMNSVRYMTNDTSEFRSGAQHPIKNHCPAEFDALFTAPDSLQATSHNTLFTVNGDLHNGHIYHHVIDEADFYEIGVGTSTGSTNHGYGPHEGPPTPPPPGGVFKGSVIEYLDYLCGFLAGVAGTTGFGNYWGVKVSVYGSKAVKELVIELMDANSAVLWSAKFLSRNGTAKFADDYVVPTIVGTVHT